MTTSSPARRILAGNWKMNHGEAATAEFFEEMGRALHARAPLRHTEILIAPPCLSLSAAVRARGVAPIALGAQNVHWEEKGAFTGEISRAMLGELGVQFAIVGHSERRHVMGESDQLCARRGAANLVPGFRVIFCVGETREERSREETESRLAAQLAPLLESLTPAQGESLVVAYEPVWAIGTGEAATLREIEPVHKFIQRTCEERSLGRVPILYGGSVTPKNASEILGSPLIDGVLVGSASLSPISFLALVECSEALT